MKKPVRWISFLIIIALAIPVFRNLCERFSNCEIMRVYSVITDGEWAYGGYA